jgi:aminoglycoside 6-adenylyltransferase
MNDTTSTNDMIQRFVHWGEKHPAVRAMLLTSTRTSPKAHVDAFSDYDVLLVVADIHPFFERRAWLEDFGRVLVVYRDPILPESTYGLGKFAWITQYEDGLKIDFMVFPVELMQRIVNGTELPDYLDVGYQVLLDKDHLTDGLKPPTYRAHIPVPPTEEVFQTVVEEFFHEATYVAKHLWRDDLMPAKYNLDYAMKHDNLRQMLEWRIEIDHHWTWKPGAYGKRLKRHLPPEIWSQLESTYVGAGLEDNWEAMFKTIDLFRAVATEVAAHLGYRYPDDLHRRVAEYLLRVKRHATSFP